MIDPIVPINSKFSNYKKIKRLNKDIEVLSEFNGTPVMIRKDNILATQFHPEKSSNSGIYVINSFMKTYV